MHGTYKEIMNSDNHKYGGSGVLNGDDMHTNDDQQISITVSPLAFMVFELKQ